MITEKKQWIVPQATEIEVNGGLIGGIYESATSAGQNGSLGPAS